MRKESQLLTILIVRHKRVNVFFFFERRDFREIGEDWIGSDDWRTIDLVYVDGDGNWIEYRENLYSLAIDGAKG